jgi:hypothetical protein
MEKHLEGPLRRYRGVLSGYKACFARLLAYDKVLILTKDIPDKKALDGYKVERIELAGAEVNLPKGAKKDLDGAGGSGDLDTQFILEYGRQNKIYLKSNT